MKTKIEVADRKEGALIRDGLKDAQVRALVKVMGALSRLPTDRARVRALRFIEDHFNEEREHEPGQDGV